MIRRATLLLACLLACVALPARAQIIQNGSFETGNNQPPVVSWWGNGSSFLGLDRDRGLRPVVGRVREPRVGRPGVRAVRARRLKRLP